MTSGMADAVQAARLAVQQQSRLGLRLRRIGRSKAAIFGGSVLLLIAVAAAIGPWVVKYPYEAQDLAHAVLTPFSDPDHPLGTDPLGRDILSRILYGARVTLAVSFTGMIVASMVGVAVGVLAGYSGGAFDTAVMRVADVQLSFPYLLLAIAIAALLGPSLPVLIGVLVVRGWVSYARTIRGVVLSLKEEEFIKAAIAAGAGTWRIVVRHLLPNALAPIIVLSSFELAAMMLIEASLSFLGLGVQPPMPSWGSMISQGRDYMYTAWWLTALPGFMLMLAVLGANQLGDGLRDLMDPRLRNRSR